MPTESTSLTQALDRYELTLDREQIEQLDAYCQLLWNWNQRLNLTRHTDYDAFVGRDVMDSIQLANLLHSDESVLDVGTGGGVPGIIVSILRPDLRVSLCDSIAKKARAVNQMVADLQLPMTVYECRVEHLLDDVSFDALVARAIGPLWKICYWLQGHWPSIGRLLAIKGPRWTEERKEARHRGFLQGLELRRAAHYPMPGTESESVILKIWPKGTPEK